METTEKLYNSIKIEIYLLVFTVLKNKKESENLTRKILIKLVSSNDIVSKNDDIHRWVARYTTLFVYRYLRQHRKVRFRKVIPWFYKKHYTENEENKFNNDIQSCCRAFAGKEECYQNKLLASFTYSQVILVQFYWYEKYNVNQIAKILKMDKDCIEYNLNVIKNKCIKQDGCNENDSTEENDENVTVIDVLFPQFKKYTKNIIDIAVALVILVIAVIVI